MLEVILALVLFVAAATVLTSGLSSSLDSVERLRLNTHAADLAVSVLSELQMGIKSLAVSGPQPFEAPLEAWTWEVVVTSAQAVTAEQTGSALTDATLADADETSPFKRVEVIIRHDDPALVYRLTQVVQIDPNQSGGSNESPAVSSEKR